MSLQLPVLKHHSQEHSKQHPSTLEEHTHSKEHPSTFKEHTQEHSGGTRTFQREAVSCRSAGGEEGDSDREVGGRERAIFSGVCR